VIYSMIVVECRLQIDHELTGSPASAVPSKPHKPIMSTQSQSASIYERNITDRVVSGPRAEGREGSTSTAEGQVAALSRPAICPVRRISTVERAGGRTDGRTDGPLERLDNVRLPLDIGRQWSVMFRSNIGRQSINLPSITGQSRDVVTLD